MVTIEASLVELRNYGITEKKRGGFCLVRRGRRAGGIQMIGYSVLSVRTVRTVPVTRLIGTVHDGYVLGYLGTWELGNLGTFRLKLID